MRVFLATSAPKTNSTNFFFPTLLIAFALLDLQAAAQIASGKFYLGHDTHSDTSTLPLVVLSVFQHSCKYLKLVFIYIAFLCQPRRMLWIFIALQFVVFLYANVYIYVWTVGFNLILFVWIFEYLNIWFIAFYFISKHNFVYYYLLFF